MQEGTFIKGNYYIKPAGGFKAGEHNCALAMTRLRGCERSAPRPQGNGREEIPHFEKVLFVQPNSSAVPNELLRPRQRQRHPRPYRAFQNERMEFKVPVRTITCSLRADKHAQQLRFTGLGGSFPRDQWCWPFLLCFIGRFLAQDGRPEPLWLGAIDRKRRPSNNCLGPGILGDPMGLYGTYAHIHAKSASVPPGQG
jgi:hypothetical protein